MNYKENVLTWIEEGRRGLIVKILKKEFKKNSFLSKLFALSLHFV